MTKLGATYLRWSRRQVLLGLLGGALTAACGESSTSSTPAPTGTPFVLPLPGTPGQPGPVPSPAPSPSSAPSPSPSPAQAGPSSIVPGRVPSPSPGAVSSPAPSPSPLPIVLGRPGLLAVEQAGRVLLVDPEKQQPVRTLVTTPDNGEPRWSPDGRLILFVGGLGPAAELRLMPSGGGPARRLTSNARPERRAAWSPRGDRLAYVLPRSLGADGRDDPAEPEEVWLLDVASGNDRKIADGFDPAWSPDGRWIVYATNGQRDGLGVHENAINVVGADGQGDRPLLLMSDLPADLQASFGLPFRPTPVRLRAPDWSPDGQRLVASADGHTSLVWTFDVRGQGLRPWVPAFEGGVGRARWSPDGQRLAVESKPATGVDVVVVVDLASRSETRIGGPAAGFQASGPTWAPDGRRLAMIAASLPARRGEPRVTALGMFGPDGADLGALLNEPDLRDPDWGRAP